MTSTKTKAKNLPLAVLVLVCGVTAATLGACAPTVKVAAEEPITINLNVKIEHEVRVSVEKELDDLFSEDSGFVLTI